MSGRQDMGKSNPLGFGWDVNGCDLESMTFTAP